MRTIRDRTLAVTLALGLLTGTVVEAPPPPPEDAAGRELASLRLVINTSARRLHVYENGERTRTYKVAVGKPGHRTPRGVYAISKAVWNPWWNPPPSRWARGKKLTPPGPRNPMGRVKLYFRNLYYIHGTPDRGSLGRAASHGCVRMSNSDVVELARLVHSYGSPHVSEAELDALTRSRRTRTIYLRRRVPVEIVSRMAEVHDGKLEIFASEEQRSERQIRQDAVAALREAGFDMGTLDEKRLGDLVRIGKRKPVSIPLAELVAPIAPAVMGSVQGS